MPRIGGAGAARGLPLVRSASDHAFFELPCAGLVERDLSEPHEVIPADLGEAPAQEWFFVEADEVDLTVHLTADERANPPVHRLDPRRSPRSHSCVEKPDRRAMEAVRGRSGTRRSDGRHRPHILNGPPAEDPSEVQIASHAERSLGITGAAPVQRPGPDEPTERLELRVDRRARMQIQRKRHPQILGTASLCCHPGARRRPSRTSSVAAASMAAGGAQNPMTSK